MSCMIDEELSQDGVAAVGNVDKAEPVALAVAGIPETSSTFCQPAGKYVILKEDRSIISVDADHEVPLDDGDGRTGYVDAVVGVEVGGKKELKTVLVTTSKTVV